MTPKVERTPQQKAYDEFWDALCRKGDPFHVPNKFLTGFNAGWDANVKTRPAASRGMMELLREIEKWCSGENQVNDGEDAEGALRYIQDAIKAFLSSQCESTNSSLGHGDGRRRDNHPGRASTAQK